MHPETPETAGTPGTDLSARITLPGSGSTLATVEVEAQPRGRRIATALAILMGSWIVMPVVFFIPPHFLWPLLVFIAGIYFARVRWVGAYVVHSFQGECPRCGGELTLEPGARIRARQSLECFGCHRQPRLELDADG